MKELEIQKLKASMQDSLRNCFTDIFYRDTNINNMSAWVPFIILLTIQFQPVLCWKLYFDTENIQEYIKLSLSITMAIRAIIFTIFITFLKKNKALISKLQRSMVLSPESSNEIELRMRERINKLRQNIHIYVLLSGTAMQILSSAKFILFYRQIFHYSVPHNLEITTLCLHEIILFAGFLIAMQIRFKFKKRFLRTIYLISLFTYNVINLGSFTVFIITIMTVLNLELVWWRNQFFKREQEHMRQEFDRQSMNLQQESERRLNQLQEEMETTSTCRINSKADELLNKLRVLKFQQLVRKNEQIRTKIVNTTSKWLTKSQMPEMNQDYSNFERSPIRQLTGKSEQKGSEKRSSLNSDSRQLDYITQDEKYMHLENEDIDDLIKIVSGRKEQIWIPHFLQSNQEIGLHKEEFSPEAKKFLLDHFTEKEFTFQKNNTQFKVDEEDMETSPSFHLKQNKDLLILTEAQKNYNFDFFEVCEKCTQSKTEVFVDYCTFVFLRYGVHKVLKITSNKTMVEFFKKIDANYKSIIWKQIFFRDNYYHSNFHAMDVTNSAAYFLDCGVKEILTDFEVACLIISSLAHDIGHPGLNNSFMVNSKSKQALLYNDQSVLENYHASLLFYILSENSSNILKNLSEGDWKGFRKYCLTLILDTGIITNQHSLFIDLQKHFQLLTKFKNYLALGEPNLKDEQNRLLVLSITIKCADVGHGAKSQRLHKLWSRRIIEEFFSQVYLFFHAFIIFQGDIEASLNMNISPLCDRKMSVTKSQEGFLKAIVLPLFEAFQELLKSDEFEKMCIDQINENIQYWLGQQKEEENIDNHEQIPFFLDTSEIFAQNIQKQTKKEFTVISLTNIVLNI